MYIYLIYLSKHGQCQSKLKSVWQQQRWGWCDGQWGWVSLLEHRINEEILEEAKMEAIATVMRRRRLEWFGHVKRRGETENIRAVAEMKMEGKRPRGRPKLRWNDTVRRDLKAWNINEEWAADRERWKCLCKIRYPEQGDGGERWEMWERWEIMYIYTGILNYWDLNLFSEFSLVPHSPIEPRLLDSNHGAEWARSVSCRSICRSRRPVITSSSKLSVIGRVNYSIISFRSYKPDSCNSSVVSHL